MIEDHGEIQLETTEGWRPDPPRGERILVVLAGMALLGAALIVGANLLARHDEVSSASGSPQASTQPSPSYFFTPFPTPSPREVALEEWTPLPQASAAPYFGGWIRPLVDLPIHQVADESAAVLGTLPAGEVAYVDEQGQGAPELGWATVEGLSDTTGWVATRSGGEDLVKRYAPTDLPVTGWFNGIAAGPSGFVAVGTPSGRSSNWPQSSIFSSADGAAWHPASGFSLAEGYPASVAWGPAGWLAVSAANDVEGSLARIWTSSDGDQWTSPGVVEIGYPESLVGSEVGYLVRGSGRGRLGGFQELAWFSADGVHWSETAPGLNNAGYVVAATSVGFYAATSPGCCDPTSSMTAAFSIDGRTWSPTKANLFVVAVDGVLLGIEPGPDGRGGLAYRGSFYRGRLDWHPIVGGDQPFVGAVVTLLVSDGRRAIAFGWDEATELALTWTSDGGPWTRHPLPEDFGGPPALAAVNGDAAVAVGNRTNSRGANPVIWHESASRSWEPERSPVLGIAPDPTAGECAAPPSDPVLFINLDRALAAACYGDAPLTIRLWSSSCDGCYGGNEGTYEEAWLANPTTNQLYLSPMVWLDGNWMNAVLSPELPAASTTSWTRTWLELTGHFDDPASARCHWTPPPAQLRYYYNGSISLQNQCRQQFVVTAVEVLDGP